MNLKIGPSLFYTSSPPGPFAGSIDRIPRVPRSDPYGLLGVVVWWPGEGEPEFRKLTPRMHRNSKPESCESSGGINLGCLVTASPFWKPVFWLPMVKTGREAAERRGHSGGCVCHSRAVLVRTTVVGFPDVANENVQISQIKSKFKEFLIADKFLYISISQIWGTL